MPAKLTIPSVILPNTKTTTLPFTSTSNGYLSGPMHLSGNSLVIDAANLYFLAVSVEIEQNGTGVVNTANIQVFRNGTRILEVIKSYNENDANTMFGSAYFNFNAGDVITSTITFSTLSTNKIIIAPNNSSTFLNVV